MEPISTKVAGLAILLTSFMTFAEEGESRFDAIGRSLGGSYNTAQSNDAVFFIVIAVLVAIVVIVSLTQKQVQVSEKKKQQKKVESSHREEPARSSKGQVNHHKDFLDQVRRK